MIYCVSDLHGCYELYLKLLERLSLTNRDTLYILGDAVDRGSDGIKILLDVMERDNVTLLQGNHDRHAAFLLNFLDKPLPGDVSPDEIKKAFGEWFSDGGLPTYRAFTLLNLERRRATVDFIKSSPCRINLTVNDRNFLLAHTVPERKIWKKTGEVADIHFLEGEPDYDKLYDRDLFIVTGHTPTSLINPGGDNKIYKANNHIAIDCGAVFGGSLGCICLDTGEEIYII